MTYEELTKEINRLHGNHQSKLGILRFFHGFDNFDAPRITLVDNKVYQAEWFPLSGGGSLVLQFGDEKVGYRWVRLWLVEVGTMPINELKVKLFELPPKPPNLPVIASDLS
jgi:hypothetical protein